jgi:hypothetical protein
MVEMIRTPAEMTPARPAQSRLAERPPLYLVGSPCSVPRPRWSLLYVAMLGAGAAGFALLVTVPVGIWQELTEVATVLGIFGAMMVWGRLNRGALGEQASRPRQAGMPLVRRVIRARPFARSGPLAPARLEPAKAPRATSAKVIQLRPEPDDDGPITYDFW